MSGTGGFPTGFPGLGVPGPGSPFVDDTGNLTPVWHAFLVALYKRTGSAAGTNPANNASSASVLAVATVGQAADAALAADIAAETAARIAADEQEAQTRAAMDDWLASTSGWQAALATEQAARIAGDQWKAGVVDSLGSGLVLSGGVLSASGGGLMLLVNGDIPVGIVCDPDGVPVYVPV
jgi:hypothetical protein